MKKIIPYKYLHELPIDFPKIISNKLSSDLSGITILNGVMKCIKFFPASCETFMNFSDLAKDFDIGREVEINIRPFTLDELQKQIGKQVIFADEKCYLRNFTVFPTKTTLYFSNGDDCGLDYATREAKFTDGSVFGVEVQESEVVKND